MATAVIIINRTYLFFLTAKAVFTGIYTSSCKTSIIQFDLKKLKQTDENKPWNHFKFDKMCYHLSAYRIYARSRRSNTKTNREIRIGDQIPGTRLSLGTKVVEPLA